MMCVKKLSIFTFLLLHSWTILYSQNLLKNGDFEKKTLFAGKPLLNFLFLNIYSDLSEVKYWDNPNRTSADIHKNGKRQGVLKIGQSKAYSGEYYLGLGFWSDGYRDEYTETKLKKVLVKDSLYCIKFYTMADSKYINYFKRLYFTFGNKYYHQRDDNFFFLPDTVGFQKTDESVIENTDDYIELSNIYRSKGEENHLILGLFNKNEFFHYLGESADYHRDVLLMKKKIAYYYFDDISVVPIKDSSQCPCYHYKKPKKYKETEQIKAGQLKDKKYTLSNVKFVIKTAKLNLAPSGKDELLIITAALQKDSLIKLTIVSHVFETDVMPQNKKLSQERAKTLKDYFISQKIDIKRIEVIGMGSSMPLFDNDTKEHQEKNTRIEIRFD